MQTHPGAVTTGFNIPSRRLTWLVTGSSSGMGLALTRALQARGSKVIATSRNPSRTPELVAEVEAKGGHWVALDVNDPTNGQLIDRLEREGHEIDVLVNNAGYSVHSPVETASDAEVRGQMETMFFGPLRLIQAVLPHMRRRRFGTIVNFSSGASLSGRDSMGVYAGAKAGLDGLTRVLAKEAAPYNIRALTVILGAFDTGMTSRAMMGKIALPDDYKDSTAAHIMQFLSRDDVPPLGGDKEKAVKAVIDLVAGEGIGKGHEGEVLLLLGSDMPVRASVVQESLSHALNVFWDTTTKTDKDK
jgi:NAD(P)-dependent dehydrogenase (short-subunit alcohol dehydrogenase family)